MIFMIFALGGIGIADVEEHGSGRLAPHAISYPILKTPTGKVTGGPEAHLTRTGFSGPAAQAGRNFADDGPTRSPDILLHSMKI
jgi:hypothetical protein